MGKIRILDESVANIIAAGEVVENPTAMLKELLENSLDAESSKVFIEIRDGGKNLKISDDGKGMGREDLLLSIERHATSKISKKEDLFNLSSYGFRGEALASICAVSKVRMSSALENSLGNSITVSGGKVTSLKEIEKERGTEIEIQDLFFNTPARLKFLRKNSTEYSSIKEVVIQEAIANPKVAITLIIEGKTVLRTSGNGLENCISELFGFNTLKNLIKIDCGYIGNSSLSRSTRDSIFSFVNGRVVKSKVVESAVIDAFYTKLSRGRYPFAIIFIEIDPGDVDVNVHPSKKIVKFSDEREIYERVRKAIEEVSTGNDILTAGEFRTLKISEEERVERGKFKTSEIGRSVNSLLEISKYIGGSKPEMLSSPKIEVQSEILQKMEISEKNEILQKNYREDEVGELEKKKSFQNEDFQLEKELSETRKKTCGKIERKESLKTVKNQIFEKSEISEMPEEKRLVLEIKASAPEKRESSKVFCDFEIPHESPKKVEFSEERGQDYKILGQFMNSYIVVENRGNLELYDQHIVHERILYEELKKEILEKRINSQNLLVPKRLRMDPREREFIKKNLPYFKEFGFDIEIFDENELLIRAVPLFDFRESLETVFYELMEELKSSGGVDPRERVIISMSCKGAIKAGEKLAMDEMETLIKRLYEIKEFTCPHGRPIIVRLSLDEIEKKFKRK